MRELVLKETFAAPAAEIFERIQDSSLEAKFLTLTKKSDVDIPPWTLKDNSSARAVSYLIQTTQSPWLMSLSKGLDVQASKFQDVHINGDATEYVLDTKIFFGQTQAVSNWRISLVVLDPISTQCSVSMKNSCKNMLLRDKIEVMMEEEARKEMTLWLELVWESQMAYTAHKNAQPEISESAPSTSLAVASTSTPMRNISSKSYTRSSQDLQELGELEEMRVLSGGMAALSDELDALRRTVESHYLRLCSLESHLTSQTVSRGSRLHSAVSTPPLQDGSVSDESSIQLPHQHLIDHTYNSLDELDARQRALRTQLSAQMQSIEKAFLKQQQASQQIKTLESRWDVMVDKMNKRLQEIDTLRYGVLGSWRQTLSIAGFIIVWPLIVRFIWIMFAKKWFTFLLRRYYWKTAVNAETTSSLVPKVASSLQSTTSAVSSIVSTITNVASRVIRPSPIAVAASTSSANPALPKLTPQSFWR